MESPRPPTASDAKRRVYAPVPVEHVEVPIQAVELDQAGQLVHRPTLEVASRSAGIGDHLLGLCFAEGLRIQRPECRVRYIAGGWVHPWLRLFGADLGESATGVPLYFLNHDTEYAEFTHAQRSRWEHWQRVFSVTCVPPILCPLPTDAMVWAQERSGGILLCPRAKYQEREWPGALWAAVEGHLCDLGYRVHVLHSDDDEKMRVFRSPHICGQSPERIAALMCSSVCVAGNDSGLSHLAGMLGRPTVAVCSGASDHNIFGLFPSVNQLGGRRVGWQATTPLHVVAAAIQAVRSGIGGFPLEPFRRVLAERDRGSLGWDAMYATYWKTLKHLFQETPPTKKIRIVEIGLRAGYSAWTALQALPNAEVHAIELGRTDVEGGLVDGGYPNAWKHAKEICGERLKVQIVDSHTLDKVPKCDLCFVDADHTEAGCLADLVLCERSGVPRIIVDDYGNFPAVREAVRKFMDSAPHRKGEFIASQTGLYLIETR